MKSILTSLSALLLHALPAAAVPGVPEPGFNPMVNSTSADEVTSATMQPDGKILIGGIFTTVAGVARNHIARLNADGTLDAGFNPDANNSVRCFVVQPDGRILIGGWFTTVGGVARNYIARLYADGTLDPGFDPNASDSIRTTVEQADGKILIGGNFSTVGGVTRNRIARLNPDGSLDAGFNPGTSDRTYNTTLQADGKVIIGGFFFTVAGATHHHIARLENDPATQTLSAVSLNRIAWLRGGSSPETREVTFEISVDGGVSYAPWGAGTRIAGGWERIGNGANPFTAYRCLPASGQIRARARTESGYYNGSKGLVESVATFSGLAVPEIALSGNGVNIVEADAYPDVEDHTDFGAQSVAAGQVLRTFTIENSGTADLVLGPIVLSGANPADFTVTVAPVSPVAAGGSTTFQLAFDPSAVDSRWAHVAIPSNDFDEYYFQFAVRGNGLFNDANLASLAPGVGTPLNPAFNPATTSYTSSVSYDTSSITVTPTAAQGAATITINGNAVPSGNASASIPLSAGTNTITTQVTAQDGGTTKTYTVVVRRPAAAPGGVVEPGFDLNLNWYDNMHNIESMALQPDGKLITSYNDITNAPISGIQRWLPSGTLDSNGSAGVPWYLRATAVQADGKILVGGEFSYTTMYGQPGAGITRLHADGTRDETFHPHVIGSVSCIAVQPDGKILIGGGFTTVEGVPRNCIARLFADGTVDMSFDPNASNVTNITQQTDGKIIIGGTFTTVGGVTRKGIARLNADGTLDPGFTAYTNDTYNGFTYGAGKVTRAVVQADGKILIAGDFTSVNGVPRNTFARLNADGTLDAGFNTLSFGLGGVYEITLQADGEILIGGAFVAFGSGVQRNSFARLHEDGTLDAFFHPAPNSAVFASLLQADGKILIGGAFSAVGGVPRNYVARLDNVPATQTLSVANANRIEWLRGGSSPEATHVAFDASTNGGSSYLPLGAGTRLTGGWELTGINLPASGLLRARARTGNGSLVESIIAFSGLLAPEITVTGNGVSITTGDTTPTLADHRDFGTRIVGTGAVVRSFTLHNNGTADLTLGSITLGGAADFTVTTAPTSPIPAGGRTNLQVTFAASAAGLRSAVLSVATNDFDER